MKRSGKGFALGKIILIGEHSVVYHKPAIAIPFSGVKMEVSVVESEKSFIDCFSYSGSLSDMPERFLGLKTVIEKVSKDLNESLDSISINIDSSIPVERGMGSSAAVACATVRALYDYYDRALSDDLLSDYVNISEKIVHGNPSGIDTAIVVYNKPLYYIKEEPLEQYEYHLDGALIVSDTGEMGNTKFAVSKVRNFIDENQERGNYLLDELESLVKDTRVSLEDNNINKVAYNMNEAQKHLSELGVSNDVIENLVHVSMTSGALASKLTGGGLGGCVITLCKDERDALRISKDLENHGAKQTWIMNMNKSEGEKLEG